MRKLLLVIISFSHLIVLDSELDSAVMNSVTITSPSNGAVVSGKNVAILVMATGSVNSVACNIYKKDGWWPVQILWRDNSVPFGFVWDTTKSILPNGQYTIRVWGYSSSTSKNALCSALINVTVKNDFAVPSVSISSPVNDASVSGTVTVSASASDDTGVAGVQFRLDGQNLGNEITTAPYQINWDTTSAIGPHALSAVARDVSGKQAISTNIHVQAVDVTNPVIVWTGPSEGPMPGSNLTLSAEASDNNRVSKVEFYDGSALLGEDADSPYNLSVNLLPGDHFLSAKAQDTAGNFNQTNPVHVVIPNPDTTPPTVQITQPASGALPLGALIRGVVTIAADASDNVGVDSVNFILKKKSTGLLILSVVDNTVPYEFSLNTTTMADGTYLLEAKAYDLQGNTGQHFRTLTVDNTLPSVTVTAPSAGDVISENPVLCTASAVDPMGIDYVEFFANGTSLGIVNDSPYQIYWDTTSYEGAVSITVEAHDRLGNFSISQPVNVNIDNNTVPPVVIADGWDWTLPSEVQIDPNYGMFLMTCNTCGIDNAAPPADLQHLLKIRGKTVYWSRLHTGDGQFDFSEIISDLADAHAKNYRIVFRLKSNETGNDNSFGDGFSHVPGWIINKYASVNPILSAYMEGGPGTSKFIKVAAVWNGFDSGETADNPGTHAGLHDEYLKFVKEFGEQGFHHDTAFAGLYLTGISASYGEEMVINSANYLNLTQIGMHPSFSNLIDAFNARMNAWAEAFDDEADKIVWTGAILFGTGTGWTGGPGHAMNQNALDQGLGIRGGTVETPFANVFSPHPYHDYGTLFVDGSTSKEGYLQGNWDWLVNREKRFHGEENETLSVFSGYEEVMYRSSILMSLLRGVNYLWTSKKVIEIDLPLSEFYAKEAGKGPDESYDAWVYLRESEQRFGSVSNYKARNFEHWLHQREAEEARTIKTKFTLRNGTNRDCDIPGVDDGDASNGSLDRGDFLARRTDFAAGENEIRIYVNDQFMRFSQTDDVTLKVTYTDDGGEWYVRYCTSSGVKSSAHVIESGTGQERTATFILKNFTPNKTITGGFDLALTAEGQDLTASFVRLIKTKPNVEAQS